MSPHSTGSPCRLAPRRRLALGGIALTSTLLAGMFAGGPAFAAATVTTKADITSAFAAATSGVTKQIALGTSLTDPDAANDVQTVPTGGTVELDLAGHELDLQRIVVSANATLLVTDSTGARNGDLEVDNSGGTETAIGVRNHGLVHVSGAHVVADGGDGGAGIGTLTSDSTGGGAIQIDSDAGVYATGGDGGAGIGGAESVAAASVVLRESRLSAQGGDGGAGIGSGRAGSSPSFTTEDAGPSSEWSYVTASGGRGAAAIGGGYLGGGGLVSLAADGYVVAEQGPVGPAGSPPPSAVGNGQGGSGFGTLTTAGGATLSIPEGSTIRTPASPAIVNNGSIELYGTITGPGTIANGGRISTPEDDANGVPRDDPSSRIASTVTVTGHNYLLTLDANGGTPGARTTVHTWNTDLDLQDGDAPTTGRAGYAFFSWNAAASGSGADVSDAGLPSVFPGSSTGTPVSGTIYAHYGVKAALASGSLPDAGLGSRYDAALPTVGEGLSYFDVEEYDENGDPIPGLPAGLSIDADTGRITGTPTQAGVYRVRVYLGGAHTYAYGWLTIEVAGSPVIATSALPAASTGSAYSTTLTATGRGAVTWGIGSGSLPAGLTLNPKTGVISGTPGAAGTSSFVVAATTSFGTTTKALGISTVVGAAATAPVLAPVVRTTVKFGHPLTLAVAASSASPVTWKVAAGSLPKGIALNPQTGVISGVAAEEGTFTASIQATNAAGSSSTPVVIFVPKVVDLISTGSVPDVKVGAGSVPVKVEGLKKGERWAVRLDGRVVDHGRMKKAGSLHISIHLKKAKKDTVHTVRVASSRKVTDPSQRAATEFTITSLVGKKSLKVTSRVDQRGVQQVVVDRLASGEKVTVTSKGRTVAKGHADAQGDYVFRQSKAGSGTHRLSVHGATPKRVGKLTVHNPKN